MSSTGSITAYSQDLLQLAALAQRANANGTTSSASSVDSSSSGGGVTSAQSANFTPTSVLFTTVANTGAAVRTTLQIYSGSALPAATLTSDQLKVLQEGPPAAPPAPAPAPADAKALLSSMDANQDGEISQSELETAAVSAGSNLQQADALFRALTPGTGDYIDESQILNALG